jgi:ssDNA-binding Zn-finger/Zn-ribbon topoisomerase 1
MMRTIIPLLSIVLLTSIAAAETCPDCGTEMLYGNKIDYAYYTCLECKDYYADFFKEKKVGEKYDQFSQLRDGYYDLINLECPNCGEPLAAKKHGTGVKEYNWSHYVCPACENIYIGEKKRVGDEFALLFAEEVSYEEVLEKEDEMRALANEAKEQERRTQIETRKTELEEKGFTQSEISRIIEGTIRIGDSEAVVLESWGRPEDINRTTTAYGISEQWVYGLGTYVYFDNGVVTTIQN